MKKKHGKKQKSSLKKEIVRHVKEDEKDFKKEIARDKSLLKRIDKPKHHSKHKDPKKHHSSPSKKAKRNKVERVMHEYKEGKLHSGSKHGPEVTNPKQAIAIAMSESRRLGKTHKKKKK